MGILSPLLVPTIVDVIVARQAGASSFLFVTSVHQIRCLASRDWDLRSSCRGEKTRYSIKGSQQMEKWFDFHIIFDNNFHGGDNFISWVEGILVVFGNGRILGAGKLVLAGLRGLWPPPTPEVSVCTRTMRPVVVKASSHLLGGAGCVCTYVGFTVLQSP